MKVFAFPKGLKDCCRLHSLHSLLENLSGYNTSATLVGENPLTDSDQGEETEYKQV